ncbi:allophanate hydrolase subunit 1 [Loktanella sp. 3ANDIMAR09]|uniref:5-oxoprolinase subunit B family protein n=1 Tax=Loktanella sp. 3ANDIMAR09 TaxID=1225657 RepID=UPI0020A14B05|nr:carboxyltransferase domain-containing protein [Loktanella sp. 3ANDIMAR09]
MSEATTAPQMDLHPMGQDGILVRFGDGFAVATQSALTAARAIEHARIDGVVEIATALASVLVRFAPDRISRAQLADRLHEVLSQPSGDADDGPGRLWTIPAVFDGPQLADAARHAGLTETAAIAALTDVRLSVLAIGFAPGQPYLGHLPGAWDMPRQTDLTPQVPAGALVTALRQLVLFANPSPTGWRWIGRCAFVPFQPDRPDPFALRAGDFVQFAATDAGTIDQLRRNQPDGLGGATCRMLT